MKLRVRENTPVPLEVEVSPPRGPRHGRIRYVANTQIQYNRRKYPKKAIKMFQKIVFLFGLAVGNIIVENYRLSIFIQDRYVHSEVAVHVKNTGNNAGEYVFGVELDENEFISSLTMRVGEKFTLGEVFGNAEAEDIYNKDAVFLEGTKLLYKI